MEKNDTLFPQSDEVYGRLRNLYTTISTAEIHGLVTGVVSAGVCANGLSWIDSILGALAPHPAAKANNRRVLLSLYHLISEQLSGMGLQFQLLLPEESEGLIARAQSLTDWCAGFLKGLNFAGLRHYDDCSQETAEALYHCVEISKLDYDSIDCSESDELAFNQVVEYVRLTAILVHSEFGGGDMEHHADRLRQMQPFMPIESTIH